MGAIEMDVASWDWRSREDPNCVPGARSHLELASEIQFAKPVRLEPVTDCERKKIP
jgi:hypothetical protein